VLDSPRAARALQHGSLSPAPDSCHSPQASLTPAGPGAADGNEDGERVASHQPLRRVVLAHRAHRRHAGAHEPSSRPPDLLPNIAAETTADGAHLSIPPGRREWPTVHCGFRIQAADVTVPSGPTGIALLPVPHPDDGRRARRAVPRPRVRRPGANPM
jgi:hypothetical protein